METGCEMWSSAIAVWYYTAKYEIDVGGGRGGGGGSGTDGIVAGRKISLSLVRSFFHLWACIFVCFCSFDNIKYNTHLGDDGCGCGSGGDGNSLFVFIYLFSV